MKNIVITGSARGLGFEMAKEFKLRGNNVVISDLKEENLIEAQNKLNEIKSDGKIFHKTCNVTSYEDLEELMKLFWVKEQLLLILLYVSPDILK